MLIFIFVFRFYQGIENIHWHKCVCSPLEEKTQWWAFSTCFTWRDPYPQNHVGLNFTENVMLMFFKKEKSLRPCDIVDLRTGLKNHVLRKCLCKNLRVVWPTGFQRNLRTKPLCFLYEAFSATLFQDWEKEGCSSIIGTCSYFVACRASLKGKKEGTYTLLSSMLPS